MKNLFSLFSICVLIFSCMDNDSTQGGSDSSEKPTEKKVKIKLNVQSNVKVMKGSSSATHEFQADLLDSVTIKKGDSLMISFEGAPYQDYITIYDAHKLVSFSVTVNPKFDRCNYSISSKLYVEKFQGNGKPPALGKKIVNNDSGNSCKPGGPTQTFTCFYNGDYACNRDLSFILNDKCSIRIGIQNIRDVTISEIVLDDGVPMVGASEK